MSNARSLVLLVLSGAIAALSSKTLGAIQHTGGGFGPLPGGDNGPSVLTDPMWALPRLLVSVDPALNNDDLAVMAFRTGCAGVLFKVDIVPGLVCFAVTPGALADARQLLALEPSVRSVENDSIYRARAQSTEYGVNQVGAPSIWNTTRGTGVRVAVLDTGIDLAHPDLPQPVASVSFIAGEGVQDADEHGTHCAGVIAARDNTIGVVGVAPQADLLIAKVLDDQTGTGSTSGIIAGINWAVLNNAKVISMSLGGGDSSFSFSSACAAAVSNGCLVVAAAGNDASSLPSYPAAFSSVIGVGAVDSTKTLADFSNTGPDVVVVAPGVGVRSTIPTTIGSTTGTRWGGSSHSVGSMVGTGTGSASGAIIHCGFGGPNDFPPGISGNIAHIRRGGTDSTGQIYTFNTKVTNAQSKGAVGVIISNNGGVNGTGTFGGNLGANFTIPVVNVSQSDGDFLVANSGIAGTVGTIPGPGYASLSGTSMATPHVAGVAALMIQAFPSVTPAQLRTALEQSAQDLGAPGKDSTYGYGLVQAPAARDYLQKLLTPRPPCPADVFNTSGEPTPDGQLTASDVVGFFGQFFNAGLLADIAQADGTAGKDGQVTAADAVLFLTSFFAGCP